MKKSSVSLNPAGFLTHGVWTWNCSHRHASVLGKEQMNDRTGALQGATGHFSCGPIPVVTYKIEEFSTDDLYNTLSSFSR